MKVRNVLPILLVALPLFGARVPIGLVNSNPDDVEWKKEVVRRDLEVERRMLRYWRYFNPLDIPTHDVIRNSITGAKSDTVVIRVLAIRVEFVEEDPDDPRTTGNGKMRLTPNDEPMFVTNECGDTVYNLYYDPPHDKVYFERMMEALANYVKLATYGKVKVEWVVKPDEDSLAYQLPHPMVYYGDPENYDYGLVYLVRDAFIAADQDSTIDFDDLDGNGIRDPEEGVLDKYVIFHAGSAWQTDIMGDTPYDLAAVTVQPGVFKYYLGYPYILLNEGTDTVWGASILPEQMSQDGVESKLHGVLFHENMHNLFYFPDLYDTYGRGAGIGAWGIMATGPYVGISGSIPEGLIPPLPNAWERVWIDWILRYIWGEWAGFLNDSILVELEPGSVPESLTVLPAAILTDSLLNFLDNPYRGPRFYKIPINSHEYFLIENKLDDLPQNNSVPCPEETIYVYGEWKDGVFVHFYGENDYLVPGKGLLIWHIDDDIIWNNYSYNTVNAVRPMGVDLLEADHVQDFEKWTDFSPYLYAWFGCPYDAFFRGNNDFVNDTTMPSTRDNYGGFTGLEIFDISEPGTLMTFKVVRHNILNGFPIRLGYMFVKEIFLSYELDIYHEPHSTYSQPFPGGIVVAENVIVDSVRYDYGTGEEDTLAVDTILEVHVIGTHGEYLAGDTMKNCGFFKGGPVICDLNGDGELEIALGTTMGKVYAWTLETNGDSTALIEYSNFPVSLPDQIRTTFSAADIDSDGNPELLVPCENQRLYALDGNGNVLFTVDVGAPGRTAPAFTGSEIIYLSADGRVFFISPDGEIDTIIGEPFILESTGTPAIGDIDRDEMLEVLVARRDGKLVCYGMDGNVEWVRNIGVDNQTSVAIGDVDNDGFGEVFVVADGLLYGFNHTGSLLSGYPVELASDTETISTPTVGDVDNDGESEVVVAVSLRGVIALDKDGKFSDFEASFPGKVNYPSSFFDIDGDGDNELIYSDSTGFLSVWDLASSGADWVSFGNGTEHKSLWVPGTDAPTTPRTFTVERIYLYPNPTYNGITWLRFKISGPSPLTVQVFTFAGEKVWESSFDARGGDFEDFKLNLADLPSGVYYVRVKFLREGKVHILKLALTR